jgi:hypothetical protein
LQEGVNGAVFEEGKTKMETGAGPGDGSSDKINLEDTSDDKTPKSTKKQERNSVFGAATGDQ